MLPTAGQNRELLAERLSVFSRELETDIRFDQRFIRALFADLDEGA
jgi:hypothetical protein